LRTIGENQSLRRAAVLSVDQGVVVSYVHNAAAPNMGKIGVLVGLESAAPAEALTALGKQLAMHIAASNPLALDAGSLDPELLKRERAIAVEKAAESGKPAAIIDKMVDGTMAKFAKENALLSQLFVIDGKTPIAGHRRCSRQGSRRADHHQGFRALQLGEGIARETSDFAAEVAAASGVSQGA
jgi:elongation factor Ts